MLTNTFSMAGLGSAFSAISPWLSVAGAVQGAIGSYYSAKSQQYQLQSQASSLQFQQSLSSINARQAEMQAQSILQAGQQQAAQYGLRAGQAKGAARASMAARGGALSEGSNVELMASQDYAKEMDLLTINANAIRAAEAARAQGVNYGIQGAMQGISAENAARSAGSISPFMAAGTSLLGSATAIGGQWFRDRRLEALAARVKGAE